MDEQSGQDRVLVAVKIFLRLPSSGYMTNHTMILPQAFYTRDVLTIAPEILGKILVRRLKDGSEIRFPVTEVEAYRGEEDLACHASKGRTKRTEIMYHSGGHVYMYLVYGIYWMLNVVVSDRDSTQALLIRGVGDTFGPGRVSRLLQLDGSFYGEPLWKSERLTIINPPDFTGLPSHFPTTILTSRRVGIDYAGEPWVSNPWRFRI